MEILAIQKNTIADELGIVAHSFLKAFNNIPVIDILDYEYFNNKEFFTMTVEFNGEVTEYEIEKFAEEDLGLELEREIPTKQCKNNCIFCFVNQLPDFELRNTLRVKDDDYRHSFISGNYITLTNVTDEDLKRIINLKLSPLYVSVHTCDEDLRKKMLGVKNCPELMPQLKKLKEGGIILHAQIVYCPLINEDLENSINILKDYCSGLAVVPVGLTRFHNPILKEVSVQDAINVINLVERKQKEILLSHGTRFVFASDEFYIKANKDIPTYESYENFDQIENGVGLLSLFKTSFNDAIGDIKNRIKNGESFKIGNYSIATGKSAYEFIKLHAEKIVNEFGGKIEVYCIENNFFGSSVTVAGLIVGSDIFNQLKDKILGDELIIPRCMLKEFGDVFLDNMTVNELSKALQIPIKVIGTDGDSFVNTFFNSEEN